MSAIQQAAVTQISTPGNSNYDPYYSNVSLLLAMNGSNSSTSFVDASPNQKTVTANGSAQISTSQFKFGGSSGYLDGNMLTFLSIPHSIDLTFESGDFTLEFWLYPTRGAGQDSMIASIWDGTSSAPQSWIAYLDTAGNFGFIIDVASADTTIFTSTNPISNSVWTHIAVARSGNTWRLFINGVLNVTTNLAASMSIGSAPLYIGTYQNKLGANTTYNGYIDDFRITKGIGRYTSNFTPPAYANPLTGPNYDPFYNNVSLLLHCNGGNASTNFIDNSGSPKTVTANGNAQISTAQWRFGGSSAYFDGNGDYLSVPASTDFALLSGDFTVEFWFKHNNPGDTTGSSFVCVGGPTGLWQILIRNNSLIINSTPDGVTYYSYSASVVLDTNWHHFAWTKQSSTHRILYDGVIQSASGTVPTSTSNNNLYIGANFNGGTTGANAYIDDLRITKGVARYTSNFTPPRLAFADSGPNFDPYYDQTVLLLPMNGANASTSFIDSSKTAKIITPNNGAQLSTTQSKFGGSSAYFNGSNYYLTIPSSTDLDISTGDFTIEAWVYLNAMPTTDTLSVWQNWMIIYERGSASASDGWQFQIGQTLLMFSDSYGTAVCSGTHGMVINTWYHLSVSRSGTTFRVFVNGVQVGTSTSSITLNSGPTYWIGTETGQGAYLNGYIDDLRVTKGISRYTSNFTVPVRPNPTTGIQYDNYYDNVSLLLHMNGPNNGTSFVDSSLRAKTSTVSSAITSTTQYKWGISSGYFNGGSSLALPTSNEFAFGLGDFTVECWVYISSVHNGAMFSSNAVNSAGSFGMFFESGVGVMVRIDGLSNDLTYNYSLNNQWVHLAAVRLNGILTLYANGTSVSSGNRSTKNVTQTDFSVGTLVGFGYYLNGYLDDLRVTKGIARYTENFTPPTQAFPDQGPQTDPFYYNTSLLLHFDGTNASTNFIDNSPVIKSITPSGNAQISTAQSKFGGSSALFNGTGDFLTIPNSSAFDLTTSFTLELWVYQTARTAVTGVFCSMGWINGVNAGSNFAVDNSGIAGFNLMLASNPTTSDEISGGFVPLNTWTHIACVRNGSTLMIFINGIQTALASAGTTLAPNPATPVTIGRYSSNFIYPFNGYIDDFRFTKGVARYTPSNGDIFYPKVSVLLHMNGSNGSTTFTDNSINTKTVTVSGNTQISTAQSVFGGSSGLFDGNGDYLQLSSSSDLALGSGDLTIEAWIYILNNTGFAVVGTLSFNAGASFRINATAMILDSSGQNSVSRSATISINTWHHVAVTRASGTVRFFLNGIQQGADQTYTQNFSGESRVIGGSVADNTMWFNGYMDDVRITKGVARYTANFTPPTQPFPDNGPSFTPPQRPFPNQ